MRRSGLLQQRESCSEAPLMTSQEISSVDNKCPLFGTDLFHCCLFVCMYLVFRDSPDSPPEEGSQKSFLILSFPRFPILSRPSVPKGWARKNYFFPSWVLCMHYICAAPMFTCGGGSFTMMQHNYLFARGHPSSAFFFFASFTNTSVSGNHFLCFGFSSKNIYSCIWLVMWPKDRVA